MSIEKAISNAAASVEIEGYRIDDRTKEWARMLLEEKITLNDYISLVMKHAEAAQ